MRTTTWNLTLDDRPLVVRLDHSRSRRELVIWIDGFPTRREQLPGVLHPFHRVAFEVDGHPCAAFLVPRPAGIYYDVSIDGKSVTDGRPDDEIGQPQRGVPFVPGRLTFDPARYYGLFPRWPRICAATCLVGGVSAAWGAALFMLTGAFAGVAAALVLTGLTACVSGVGWWWQDLRRKRDQFTWGDARPAVVVGTSPVRIAVALDLAVGEGGFYPAVVIAAQPLDGLRDHAVGDRLVALAWYEHTQNGRYWQGVDVVAAECGTSDEVELRRLAATISAKDWQRLEDWWTSAGQPTAPGTWPVSVPGSAFTTKPEGAP